MAKQMTVVRKSDNILAVRRPDLLEEWDWERNDELGLDPYKLTCGSGKKVHWICKECGHHYPAYPYRRSRGSGCIKCAKRNKASNRHESLAIERPDLAEEWHPELNDGLTPDDVTTGSEKKVWWLCPEHNHAYEAQVKARANQGTGCPICAGKQVLPGFNDLATKNPEVAAEWHPERNSDVTPDQVAWSTHVKYWWICRNHDVPVEWEASPHNRCHGEGCPSCGAARSNADRMIPDDGDSLADKYPHIAAQWHPSKNGKLSPSDFKCRSSKKVWWRCPACGYEWKSAIAGRTSQDSGCAVCSGKKLLRGVNDLATVAPDIAREWHPTKNGSLRPSDITARNRQSVWWLGKCDHEWTASPYNRVVRHSGCPTCYQTRRVSFPEKAIYYYVSQVFADARENERFALGGRRWLETDIFIPSLGIGIEYDGAYWHQDTDRDLKKDEELLGIGIRLIRIRENGCATYDTQSSIIARCDESAESLDDAITQVLALIGHGGEVSVNSTRDAGIIRQIVRAASGEQMVLGLAV